MAKRLTDTTKWQKSWFSELPLKMKVAWFYLTENCDHAGIVEKNYKLMKFMTGENYDDAGLHAFFGERLCFLDDKIIIVGFAEFQYGSLDKNTKIIASVRKRLDSVGFSISDSKQLSNSSVTVSEQLANSTSISISKSKSNLVLSTNNVECTKLDFDAAYREFPRKVGKSRGIKICKKEIKNLQDYENLLKAIKNYAENCKFTEVKFIKHFSTFMGEWRDWIDFKPENGGITDAEWDALVASDSFKGERSYDRT